MNVCIYVNCYKLLWNRLKLRKYKLKSKIRKKQSETDSIVTSIMPVYAASDYSYHKNTGIWIHAGTYITAEYV